MGLDKLPGTDKRNDTGAIFTGDLNVENIMISILQQLQLMNKYLESMSDEQFENSDLEGEEDGFN